MPASVVMTDATGRVLPSPIELGELTLDQGEAGQGEPVKFYVKNVGDTVLKDITVGLIGEGAKYVSLSKEVEGRPGVWAEVGRPIIPSLVALFPLGAFAFYAKAVYRPDDVEGLFPFEFVIQATSVGD